MAGPTWSVRARGVVFVQFLAGEVSATAVGIWTLVTVIVACGVAGIGYLYRRKRGLDTPPEPEESAEGHQNELRYFM